MGTFAVKEVDAMWNLTTAPGWKSWLSDDSHIQIKIIKPLAGQLYFPSPAGCGQCGSKTHLGDIPARIA